MSSGLMMSRMFTIEETETLPSLIPPSPAMCEWQSMMPGIRYCPPASITVAPCGTITFSPTSRILPSFTTTEPLNVPLLPTVMTVGSKGTFKGSVVVKDGKILEVGEKVMVPQGATVIDAGGQYLIPGIIDCHSHIAGDGGINEGSVSVSSMVNMP